VSHRARKRVAALAALSLAAVAAAGPGQKAVLDHFGALAKADNPAFAGFSVVRGKGFFLVGHRGGNADTPSCSTCHTKDPTKSGQTRAGQAIAPMAVSVTPDRFSDLAKVEKWFKRNCDTVLGRECTPLEKGDFITFLSSK
jgi:Domain of unknown function (DUF1924)